MIFGAMAALCDVVARLGCRDSGREQIADPKCRLGTYIDFLTVWTDQCCNAQLAAHSSAGLKPRNPSASTYQSPPILFFDSKTEKASEILEKNKRTREVDE